MVISELQIDRGLSLFEKPRSRLLAPFFAWILPLFFASAVTSSCASYVDYTGEMREAVYRGEYSLALEKLETSEVKTQSRNRLLYSLESGMILWRLGQIKRAKEAFFEADRLVAELYTESVSKQVSSYVINDSVTDYAGEDYEKVSIHMILALMFIEEKDFQSARVEAKKINSALKSILDQYDDDYSSYKSDAFALFLSGLIYEKLGELDSAIIDYKKSLEVYTNGYLPGSSVPASLVKSLYLAAVKRNRTKISDELKESYSDIVAELPSNSSSIIFIGTASPVTPKESKSFILNTGSGVIRYSWPVIPLRSSLRAEFPVTVDQKEIQLELGQDMNSIARKTLDSNRTRMTVKNIARLIAKAAVVNEISERAGPVAGLLANLANAVTETADTRSWTLLPGEVYIERHFLAPGKTYKVEARSAGRLIEDSVKLKREDLEFYVLKGGREY